MTPTLARAVVTLTLFYFNLFLFLFLATHILKSSGGHSSESGGMCVCVCMHVVLGPTMQTVPATPARLCWNVAAVGSAPCLGDWLSHVAAAGGPENPVLPARGCSVFSSECSCSEHACTCLYVNVGVHSRVKCLQSLKASLLRSRE